MLRRSVLGLLAAVVLVMVLAPSVGAAPAKWGPVQPPISPVWGWKPYDGTGLDYRFEYREDSSELLLYALNPTGKDITVSTPGKTKVEFVLWQGNKVVWRSGQGEAQKPGVFTERFRPGEGKIYRQSLPSLQAGTYFVQAYYLGETAKHPVASNYIWVTKIQDPLAYEIQFMNQGWFNQGPRLRVTIKNESGKDIKMPYQYGYQVLVKKAGDRNYLGTVGIGQSIGSIENGASRYVFVDLAKLSPGFYQADVRSNLGGGDYKVVTQTSFYVQ